MGCINDSDISSVKDELSLWKSHPFMSSIFKDKLRLECARGFGKCTSMSFMSLGTQLLLYFWQPFFVGKHLDMLPSKAPSGQCHLQAVGEELQI
ncbi:IS3 family transposase [Sesbania bispinosa]|nr:IS3 family transposase [Sesbania bispinosa]